jgi:urea transport system permease protein
VIRWLYGRPLETLLATWGISLVLIQTVRSVFGAQNVAVENPRGSRAACSSCQSCPALQPDGNHRLRHWSCWPPWAADHQNAAGPLRPRRDAKPPDGKLHGREYRRASIPCVCVWARASLVWQAARSHRWATSGRIWVRATSSIPSWSWCWAGWASLPAPCMPRLGLGVLNKLFEGWTGAVLAKIAILVIIIVFIQNALKALFALKGRFVERPTDFMSDNCHAKTLPNACTPKSFLDGTLAAFAAASLLIVVPVLNFGTAGSVLHLSDLLGVADRQDHVLRHRCAWRWI